MSKYKYIRIFGLGDSVDFSRKVCEHLGENLSKQEECFFDDGECYVRSTQNVRGADVFVICSLYNSSAERLADKVMKLLFFVGSLRDASAERVTLVIPYMSYQRQDRKNKSRAPIYTKYFPQILESVLHQGDRILVVDPHNLSAFQSGHRLANDHLEAKNLIAAELARQIEVAQLDTSKLVILSPDEGGVKRTRFSRDTLNKLLDVSLDLAYVDKTHGNDGLIEAHKVIGDVEGKQVIVFDDMISSAKTMVEARTAVEKSGGQMWAVGATHGLCVGDADKHIRDLVESGVKVIITDTVHPLALSEETYSKLKIVSTVPLIAEGIRCIHNEESISRLLR